MCPRCLVPAFGGAYFSREWKEALWDRYCTGAPQRQRRSVEGGSAVQRQIIELVQQFPSPPSCRSSRRPSSLRFASTLSCRSMTACTPCHFATVFGLMPCRLESVLRLMREDPHLTFRGLPRGILNPTNFLHIYVLWKTVQLARPFDSKRHGDMLSSKRLKNTHQTRFKFASI
jgi:hypothetical protein